MVQAVLDDAENKVVCGPKPQPTQQAFGAEPHATQMKQQALSGA